MSNDVITISRSFGSGGKLIGKAPAERLGIDGRTALIAAYLDGQLRENNNASNRSAVAVGRCAYGGI